MKGLTHGGVFEPLSGSIIVPTGSHHVFHRNDVCTIVNARMDVLKGSLYELNAVFTESD